MSVLECDLFQGAGNAELEACAVSDPAHILRGGRSGPHVGKIQAALRKLGFSITDPNNVYGESTERAVLKFKGPPRMILGPRQRQPDGIVGKQTIAQLDKEIAALEGKQPKPEPLEFGSTNWQFTFFGNTGFTGKGVYSLFIGSLDFGKESQNFDIDEQFSTGSLKAGFKGDSKGTFQTSKKILVQRFNAAHCRLNIFKPPFSDLLQGSLSLNLIGDDNLGVFLPIQNLKDETLGTSVTTGNFIMNGFTRKH